MSETIAAPSSQESEMMILGCMLVNASSLNFSSECLTQEDFYHLEHKTIFDVMSNLYKEGKSADIHLVSEELKRNGKLERIGGVSYLTTLAQYAGTSAYIEEYCEGLKKKSLSRKLVYFFESGHREFLADPKNPEKKAEEYQQQLVKIVKGHSPSDKTSIGEILSGSDSKPLINRLKERQEFYKKHGKPFLTGIPTGYIDFDNTATILEDTNLIVLAGRPAMGKTAFALNILSNICFEQQLPVGFISLEMGADQLAERILSMRTGIAGEKMKRGGVNNDELQKLQIEDEKLRQAKFFIHAQAISTVSQVVSRARRLKDEENIRILAIDYLQLLGTDRESDSRQYEVAEVSRTLKLLAMELRIPILVLAQLSRKVEERDTKRPSMSDLRDSGQIEQDADSIVFIYRPQYYDPQDRPGQAVVMISKNRHGSVGDVTLSVRLECGAFENFTSSNITKLQTISKSNGHQFPLKRDK
jgi:replicative DNA helicase